MPLWQAPAVLVIIVTWLTAPATSLADLSRREALRRQLSASSSASFSNDTLPYMPPPVMTDQSMVIAAPAGSADAGAATGQTTVVEGELAGPPPPPDAEPEPETRGEDYWRTRMESARAALDRDQVLLDAMQTRINSLQTDIVNRDDPAQRAMLQQQLTRAMGEMERLAKQIEADQQEISVIQTEARQQGVPPGWIR